MSNVAKFHDTKSALICLHEMREHGGPAQTTGLKDEVILSFLGDRTDLGLAIERGYERFRELQKTKADFLALDEKELALFGIGRLTVAELAGEVQSVADRALALHL